MHKKLQRNLLTSQCNGGTRNHLRGAEYESPSRHQESTLPGSALPPKGLDQKFTGAQQHLSHDGVGFHHNHGHVDIPRPGEMIPQVRGATMNPNVHYEQTFSPMRHQVNAQMGGPPPMDLRGSPVENPGESDGGSSGDLLAMAMSAADIPYDNLSDQGSRPSSRVASPVPLAVATADRPPAIVERISGPNEVQVTRVPNAHFDDLMRRQMLASGNLNNVQSVQRDTKRTEKPCYNVPQQQSQQRMPSQAQHSPSSASMYHPPSSYSCHQSGTGYNGSSSSQWSNPMSGQNHPGSVMMVHNSSRTSSTLSSGRQEAPVYMMDNQRPPAPSSNTDDPVPIKRKRGRPKKAHQTGPQQMVSAHSPVSVSHHGQSGYTPPHLHFPSQGYNSAPLNYAQHQSSMDQRQGGSVHPREKVPQVPSAIPRHHSNFIKAPPSHQQQQPYNMNQHHQQRHHQDSPPSHKLSPHQRQEIDKYHGDFHPQPPSSHAGMPHRPTNYPNQMPSNSQMSGKDQLAYQAMLNAYEQYSSKGIIPSPDMLVPGQTAYHMQSREYGKRELNPFDRNPKVPPNSVPPVSKPSSSNQMQSHMYNANQLQMHHNLQQQFLQQQQMHIQGLQHGGPYIHPRSDMPTYIPHQASQISPPIPAPMANETQRLHHATKTSSNPTIQAMLGQQSSFQGNQPGHMSNLSTPKGNYSSPVREDHHRKRSYEQSYSDSNKLSSSNSNDVYSQRVAQVIQEVTRQSQAAAHRNIPYSAPITTQTSAPMSKLPVSMSSPMAGPSVIAAPYADVQTKSLNHETMGHNRLQFSNPSYLATTSTVNSLITQSSSKPCKTTTYITYANDIPTSSSLSMSTQESDARKDNTITTSSASSFQDVPPSCILSQTSDERLKDLKTFKQIFPSSDQAIERLEHPSPPAPAQLVLSDPRPDNENCITDSDCDIKPIVLEAASLPPVPCDAVSESSAREEQKVDEEPEPANTLSPGKQNRTVADERQIPSPLLHKETSPEDNTETPVLPPVKETFKDDGAQIMEDPVASAEESLTSPEMIQTPAATVSACPDKPRPVLTKAECKERPPIATKRDTHACHLCSECFKDIKDIRHHINRAHWHWYNQPYVCKECLVIGQNWYDFQQHVYKTHRRAPPHQFIPKRILQIMYAMLIIPPGHTAPLLNASHMGKGSKPATLPVPEHEDNSSKTSGSDIDSRTSASDGPPRPSSPPNIPSPPSLKELPKLQLLSSVEPEVLDKIKKSMETRDVITPPPEPPMEDSPSILPGLSKDPNSLCSRLEDMPREAEEDNTRKSSSAPGSRRNSQENTKQTAIGIAKRIKEASAKPLDGSPESQMAKRIREVARSKVAAKHSTDSDDNVLSPMGATYLSASPFEQDSEASITQEGAAKNPLVSCLNLPVSGQAYAEFMTKLWVAIKFKLIDEADDIKDKVDKYCEALDHDESLAQKRLRRLLEGIQNPSDKNYIFSSERQCNQIVIKLANKIIDIHKELGCAVDIPHETNCSSECTTHAGSPQSDQTNQTETLGETQFEIIQYSSTSDISRQLNVNESSNTISKQHKQTNKEKELSSGISDKISSKKKQKQSSKRPSKRTPSKMPGKIPSTKKTKTSLFFTKAKMPTVSLKQPTKNNMLRQVSNKHAIKIRKLPKKCKKIDKKKNVLNSVFRKKKASASCRQHKIYERVMTKKSLDDSNEEEDDKKGKDTLKHIFDKYGVSMEPFNGVKVVDKPKEDDDSSISSIDSLVYYPEFQSEYEDGCFAVTETGYVNSKDKTIELKQQMCEQPLDSRRYGASRSEIREPFFPETLTSDSESEQLPQIPDSSKTAPEQSDHTEICTSDSRPKQHTHNSTDSSIITPEQPVLAGISTTESRTEQSPCIGIDTSESKLGEPFLIGIAASDTQDDDTSSGKHFEHQAVKAEIVDSSQIELGQTGYDADTSQSQEYLVEVENVVDMLPLYQMENFESSDKEVSMLPGQTEPFSVKIENNVRQKQVKVDEVKVENEQQPELEPTKPSHSDGEHVPFATEETIIEDILVNLAPGNGPSVEITLTDYNELEDGTAEIENVNVSVPDDGQAGPRNVDVRLEEEEPIVPENVEVGLTEEGPMVPENVEVSLTEEGPMVPVNVEVSLTEEGSMVLENVEVSLTEEGPMVPENVEASLTEKRPTVPENVEVSLTEERPTVPENVEVSLTEEGPMVSENVEVSLTEEGPMVPENVEVSLTEEGSMVPENVEISLTEEGPMVPENVEVSLTEEGPMVPENVEISLTEEGSMVPKNVEVSLTEKRPMVPENVEVSLTEEGSMVPENVEISLTEEGSMVPENVEISLTEEGSMVPENVEISLTEEGSMVPEKVEISLTEEGSMVPKNIEASLTEEGSMVPEDVGVSLTGERSAEPENVEVSLAEVEPAEPEDVNVNISDVGATEIDNSDTSNAESNDKQGHVSDSPTTDHVNESLIDGIYNEDIPTVEVIDNNDVQVEEESEMVVCMSEIDICTEEVVADQSQDEEQGQERVKSSGSGIPVVVLKRLTQGDIDRFSGGSDIEDEKDAPPSLKRVKSPRLSQSPRLSKLDNRCDLDDDDCSDDYSGDDVDFEDIEFVVELENKPEEQPPLGTFYGDPSMSFDGELGATVTVGGESDDGLKCDPRDVEKYAAYFCSICFYPNTQEKCVKSHMTRYHGKGRLAHKIIKKLWVRWQCLICEFTSLSKDDVESHIKSEHVALEPLLECPSCDEKCSDVSAVHDHLLMTHKDVSTALRIVKKAEKVQRGVMQVACLCDRKNMSKDRYKSASKEISRLSKYLKEDIDWQKEKFQCILCSFGMPSEYFIRVHCKQHLKYQEYSLESGETCEGVMELLKNSYGCLSTLVFERESKLDAIRTSLDMYMLDKPTIVKLFGDSVVIQPLEDSNNQDQIDAAIASIIPCVEHKSICGGVNMDESHYIDPAAKHQLTEAICVDKIGDEATPQVQQVIGERETPDEIEHAVISLQGYSENQTILSQASDTLVESAQPTGESQFTEETESATQVVVSSVQRCEKYSDSLVIKDSANFSPAQTDVDLVKDIELSPPQLAQPTATVVHDLAKPGNDFVSSYNFDTSGVAGDPIAVVDDILNEANIYEREAGIGFAMQSRTISEIPLPPRNFACDENHAPTCGHKSIGAMSQILPDIEPKKTTWHNTGVEVLGNCILQPDEMDSMSPVALEVPVNESSLDDLLEDTSIVSQHSDKYLEIVNGNKNEIDSSNQEKIPKIRIRLSGSRSSVEEGEVVYQVESCDDREDKSVVSKDSTNSTTTDRRDAHDALKGSDSTVNKISTGSNSDTKENKIRRKVANVNSYGDSKEHSSKTSKHHSSQKHHSSSNKNTSKNERDMRVTSEQSDKHRNKYPSSKGSHGRDRSHHRNQYPQPKRHHPHHHHSKQIHSKPIDKPGHVHHSSSQRKKTDDEGASPAKRTKHHEKSIYNNINVDAKGQQRERITLKIFRPKESPRKTSEDKEALTKVEKPIKIQVGKESILMKEPVVLLSDVSRMKHSQLFGKVSFEKRKSNNNGKIAFENKESTSLSPTKKPKLDFSSVLKKIKHDKVVGERCSTESNAPSPKIKTAAVDKGDTTEDSSDVKGNDNGRNVWDALKDMLA